MDHHACTSDQEPASRSLSLAVEPEVKEPTRTTSDQEPTRTTSEQEP